MNSSPGRYSILVNGVNQTGNFTIMGVGSPYTYPWTVGETLSATISPMPGLVVIVFNNGGGGASIIGESNLTPILNLPLSSTGPASVGLVHSPAFGNTTTLFTFNDSSTGSYISSYTWIFNDGNIADWNTASTQNATRSLPCSVVPSCIYEIDHSVTNSAGTPWQATSWLNRSAWVTVYQNLTPTVTFTPSRTSGPAGCLSVTFTATPAGAIGVDNWSWTFGDGGTSDLQNPPIPIPPVGSFTVTLTATNSTLGQTTVTK